MASRADQDTSETRRLQISGGSTYIVSLPKGWVEGMGIRAGEHVTIVRNPNRSLTLFSGGGAAGGGGAAPGGGAVIQAGQKDTPGSVKRKIIAAYLAGYKSVQVRSKGMRIRPAHARAVRGLVRTSMVGTEIVESSSEAMTVQVLTRLPELSFGTALKRMYLMSVNMHREAMEALAAADVAHGEEVAGMDEEVDRFGLYMRRNLAIAIESAGALQDMGLRRASDCLGYRTAIGRIERVADHAVLIAKRVRFVEGGIEPRILGMVQAASGQALRVFENAVAALMNRDYDMAEGVAAEADRVIEKEKGIMSEVRDASRNSGVVRFVLEDIRRTAEYSADIAEVAIDENIGSVISAVQGAPGDG